jgi:hypothetical protein
MTMLTPAADDANLRFDCKLPEFRASGSGESWFEPRGATPIAPTRKPVALRRASSSLGTKWVQNSGCGANECREERGVGLEVSSHVTTLVGSVIVCTACPMYTRCRYTGIPASANSRA